MARSLIAVLLPDEAWVLAWRCSGCQWEIRLKEPVRPEEYVGFAKEMLDRLFDVHNCEAWQRNYLDADLQRAA